MICSKCGKENRVEANYCRFCQTLLTQKRSEIHKQSEISDDSIIGRKNIIDRLNGIINIKINDKVREEAGYQPDMDNKLLLFVGESGTGKTFVANWFKNKLLQKQLVSGNTNSLNVNELKQQYGNEFLLSDFLHQNMNKIIIVDDIHRDVEYAAEIFRAITSTKLGIICICIGRDKPIEDFLKDNPDIKQKIYSEPFIFTPYSNYELTDILKLEIKQRGYKLSEKVDDELFQLVTECNQNPDKYHNNGWLVKRDIWHLIRAAHSTRNKQNNPDFNTILPEDIPLKNHKRTEEEIFAELNALPGLEEVKAQIWQIWAAVKTTMKRRKLGLTAEMPKVHLVFRGSPGTAKTTVARLLAELFFSIGLTYKKTIVEVCKADLCGQYLGQTAIKVKEKCDEAMGGVLFIDEAYMLVTDSYGQDAIDNLLKRMEDDRGKFIVIVAGYSDKMETFLKSNPGLPSRFNYHINFKDFTPDTLFEIYQFFATKESFTLTDAAKKKASNVITKIYIAKQKDFANARTMRNLWDNTFRKYSMRCEQLSEEEKTLNVLKTIEVEDIPEAA